jgi:protoheme IX farnesyltransferase
MPRIPPAIANAASKIFQVEEPTMKTFANPSLGLSLAPESSLMARLPDFITLMKPRVMMLAVFTALVGLAGAPRELDPLHAFVAALAIAAGAGAAGALNMWYDADIDAIMIRTAMRPIPRGKVSRVEALGLGLSLATGAVLLLAVATNVAAAALLGGTIIFYIVVYTVWLKRSTSQNIVIGGAAGALPPVVGWTAATGNVALEPLVLFLIIFVWTPPHFWALALNRADDYARAGVPMLPVVSGAAATKRQIVIYSALLVPTSLLPWAIGSAGAVYGATAAICGAIFVVLAFHLRRSNDDRSAAHRLFIYSIAYLFVLFTALLVNPGSSSPWPSTSVSQGARTAAWFVRVNLLPATVRPDVHFSGGRASEI